MMCAAANQGHPKAQHVLGLFYEGRNAILWPSRERPPVRPDHARALMWYGFAMAKGVREAATYRDALLARITALQRFEAERLAKNWRPNPRACGTAGKPAAAPRR